MTNKIGWQAVGVTVAITTALWLGAKSGVGEIVNGGWTSSSQILSLIAVVLMAWSLVLATRLSIFEDWFGGLDKVMRAHHLLGAVALVLIINHPLFLVVEALPNKEAAARYVWLSNNVSYNWGVGALYGLIIVLALTLVVRLPYHFWLKTHDLIGLVWIGATVHILTVNSDVSFFAPLRGWIIGVLAGGMAAYGYKVFFYNMMAKKYDYKVREKKDKGMVQEVFLEAEKERVKFSPGQFVFVAFESEKEKHPFTISSSPSENEIRLSIKKLGDYTSRLGSVAVGERVTVWGPYGRMYRGYENKSDLVMIAGGIGVTPFLSMLGQEEVQPKERRVDVFYSASSVAEATYDEELKKREDNNQRVKYYPRFGERITVEYIREKLGSLDQKNYLICGPTKMMEELEAKLVEAGVKQEKIFIEDFAFK